VKAVSLAEAARELGKSEETLRRWVREGAPTARLGESGRGRGSRVDPEALRHWRKGGGATIDAREFVRRLGDILQDYHRAGDHRLVGLSEDRARRLYAALLEYVAGRLDVNHSDE
jgi:hypothetical protein